MLYETKNSHGGDIYDTPISLDFSINCNPFGMPDGVKAAIIESIEEVVYYPDPYCRKLISAIAQKEKLPKSYILCGNGAAELIYTYCQAVKPQKVLELAPTFSEYSEAAQLVGTNVTRFYLSKGNGFRLGRDFLDFIESESFDVLFLCNPNNPDGNLIPEGMLEKILKLCSKKGMRLFLDECFLDFTDNGKSLSSQIKEYRELTILKAFTKNYSLAGLRLGYCLSSDHELLKQMSAFSQPWNVSVPAQAAGIAAIKDESHIKRARDLLRTERPWLAKQLRQLGLSVYSSDANYLLFEGPIGLDKKLRQLGIAIRNCDNYQGLEAGWYRTAVRLHEENIQLIAAIRTVIQE